MNINANKSSTQAHRVSRSQIKDVGTAIDGVAQDLLTSGKTEQALDLLENKQKWLKRKGDSFEGRQAALGDEVEKYPSADRLRHLYRVHSSAVFGESGYRDDPLDTAMTVGGLALAPLGPVGLLAGLALFPSISPILAGAIGGLVGFSLAGGVMTGIRKLAARHVSKRLQKREMAAQSEELKGHFDQAHDPLFSPASRAHVQDEIQHQMDLSKLKGESDKLQTLQRASDLLQKSRHESLSDSLAEISKNKESKQSMGEALSALPPNTFGERPLVREQRQRVELLEAGLQRIDKEASQAQGETLEILTAQKKRYQGDILQAQDAFSQVKRDCETAESLLLVNDVTGRVESIMSGGAQDQKAWNKIEADVEFAKDFLGAPEQAVSSESLQRQASAASETLGDYLDGYLASAKGEQSKERLANLTSDKKQEIEAQVGEIQARVQSLVNERARLEEKQFEEAKSPGGIIESYQPRLEELISVEQGRLRNAQNLLQNFGTLRASAVVDDILGSGALR